MQYLIDGHNLIPKLGLRLDSRPMMKWNLSASCRNSAACSGTVEILFRRAAPVGQASIKKFGIVTAHFVRLGTTADSRHQNQAGEIGPRRAQLDCGQFRS